MADGKIDIDGATETRGSAGWGRGGLPDVDSAPPEGCTPAHWQKAPGKRPHALLLDPDSRLLDTLGKLFETLGYRTTLARNGIQAAWHVRRKRFDLAVVDLELLIGEDGHLLGTIRKLASDARVVITSAWCPFEVQGLMGAEWGDAWLFKPFGITELIASLLSIRPEQGCGRKRHEGRTAPDRPPVPYAADRLDR